MERQLCATATSRLYPPYCPCTQLPPPAAQQPQAQVRCPPHTRPVILPSQRTPYHSPPPNVDLSSCSSTSTRLRPLPRPRGRYSSPGDHGHQQPLSASWLSPTPAAWLCSPPPPVQGRLPPATAPSSPIYGFARHLHGLPSESNQTQTPSSVLIHMRRKVGPQQYRWVTPWVTKANGTRSGATAWTSRAFSRAQNKHM